MQARASLEDIKEKLDAGEAALEDIKLLLINCSPKEFNDLLSGKAFQAAFKTVDGKYGASYYRA